MHGEAKAAMASWTWVTVLIKTNTFRNSVVRCRPKPYKFGGFVILTVWRMNLGEFTLVK